MEAPIDQDVPVTGNAVDVPSASTSQENTDFRVDVTAIESVSKDQQASELQPLGLDVFDHATLEKGIISQVKAAIQAKGPMGEKSLPDVSMSGQEEGEIDDPDDQTEEDEFSRKIRLGEVTPFDKSKEGESFQKKSKSGLDALLHRYMENQKLQNSRKKKSSKGSPTKPQPPKFSPPKRRPKGPKEFDATENNKKAKGDEKPAKKGKKGKFLGTKTKKKVKKEKLGTRKSRGAARNDTTLQPGEENTVNFEDSGAESEYLPSESEKSDSEQPKSKKRLKNVMSEVSKLSSVDSESEWESSDDELLNKRRSDKELDDGNPHYFSRRLKKVGKDSYLNELNIVMDEFKCPKIVWDQLYKYQQVAVKWFWELNQMRCGGILGDEMGLGKTIQVIAFLSGLYVSDLYDYDTGYSGLGPTLIVCPTTVMHQWVREFHKWFPLMRVAILHESGTFSTTGKEKSRLVDSIHSHDYGVLITSYTGLVKRSVKILSKQWHYVILDEGHKIRNTQAQVTTVAKQIETPHRLILSGSPLQNNLKELWSLFDFIYPGKLGTLQVFSNVFHMPIVAGGYANASPAQVMQAYKCAVTLKDTITPYLLRRMKRDVNSHIRLPPKTEQVLFCKLTDTQRDLYLHYLKNVNLEDMFRGNARVFVGLIDLRKICNHPDLYSGGPSKDFTLKDDEVADEDRFGYWERAGKMVVVKTLLKIWNQQKHRVLLFTQTQKMLLILEDFIKRTSYNYLKLDGSTAVASRQPLIDKFNKDTSYFVMLLTTKVGGLGVNLTGANRVVIYDPDWNPATDTQARERAWRIGQQRDVTVYRLVTAGTIEEKIYHRQIFKQFLSNKVLSDPKQRRFFKSNDLSELFTLNETVQDGTTETAAIFAGTGSEVKLSKLTPRRKRKLSVKEEAQDPKITFTESKIEQMKKLAQLLSKKIANKAEPQCPDKSEGSANKAEPQCPDKSEGLANIVEPQCPDKPEGLIVKNPIGSGVGKTSEKETEESPQSAENIKPDEENAEKEKEKLEGSIENGTPAEIYGPDGQIIQEIVRKLKSDNSKISETVKIDSKATDQQTTVTSKSSTVSTDENDNHTRKRRSVSSDDRLPGKRRHKDSKRGKFEGHEVPNLVKCKKVKKSREEEEKEEAAKSQDDYVLQKLFSKSGIGTALQHDTIMQGGPHDYAIIEAEADRVAQEAIKALKESSAHVPVVRKPLFKPTKQGSALLSAIKKRNLIVDASDTENELARNLVTYLSSKGGKSSTDQIIGEFSSKIPETHSALFKSLLGKIATFRRGSDKVGYWTLKDEFKTEKT